MTLRVLSSLDNVPVRPRKPSAMARKLIFSHQGAGFVFWLLGLIFASIGVIMSLIFLWGLPVDLAIAVSGREVQATVLDANERTDVKIKVNGARRVMYEVQYQYELDGVQYTSEGSTISPEAIRASISKQLVTLEVASFHPTWSRFKGSTYNFFGYIPLFVLIFPILGLSFLLSVSISRSRRRRAFTEGLPVLATIISAGLNYSVRINRRHPFRVVWSFEHKGIRYEGSLSSMYGLSSLAVGQPVVVLYDPEKPHINTLYID